MIIPTIMVRMPATNPVITGIKHLLLFRQWPYYNIIIADKEFVPEGDWW
jgi:hypothetical protein